MRKGMLAALCLALSACGTTPTDNTASAPEADVTLLPLSGPVSVRESELSGLAWVGDTLILLPQYPSLVGNAVYGLSRDAIVSTLDAISAGREVTPLQPRAIALSMPPASDFPGYQGLEALAVDGHRAWVSIETTHEGVTGSVLLRGEFSESLSELRLDTAPRALVKGRSGVENYAEESLLWYRGKLISLHEANGANVNPKAQAQRFDAALNPQSAIAFPSIEYRITDATQTDAEGNLWVINSLYRRSLRKLNPGPDQITERHGTPPSQAAGDTVERLLPLQIGTDAIELRPRPPIYLRLAADGKARNWEGLARLPERNGFLLVTDKFPRTLLGFVPQSSAN